MGIKVGIDLGTTYSAVAWINPASGRPEIIPNIDGGATTPSVVHFLRNGDTECGIDAKEAWEFGEENCAAAFKRHMGTDDVLAEVCGRKYCARDLSAIMLQHLKKQAEKVIGKPVTDAIITCPAYFHNKEREDTIDAGKAAGLNVLGIVNEPTAAAMCYGTSKWRENAIIMVYDLGGGTFDVTIVGMDKNHVLQSLGTDGDHMLGGKDWDKRLGQLVLKKINDEYGLSLSPSQQKKLESDIDAASEGWKKELSRQQGRAVCKAEIPGSGVASVVVTREEFDSATADLLENTGVKCQQVLRKKGLTWDNVTDVLLVGGSTRMPQVREYLKAKQGGKDPISHVNPDEAVAIGAAIYSQSDEQSYKVILASVSGGRAKTTDELTGSELVSKFSGKVGEAEAISFASVTPRDVQAHGLGIVAVNEEGTKYINENIVPANTAFPVKCAKAVKFFTQPNQDNEMDIFVLEGDEIYPELNTYTGKYVVSGIRHENGGARIRVQYSYDRNSIVHVQARQGNSCVDLPIREEKVTEQDKLRFMKPVEKKTVAGGNCTLVMALDVSGSMSGEPIEDAKNAMMDFAEKYRGTGTKVGIMVVSDSCLWKIRPTDDINKCVRAIRSIKCGETGGGNEGDPFDDIYFTLSGIAGTRYAIVLADGMWYNQELAVARAKRCHQAGIEVIGMGFGSADKKFLKQISSRADLSQFTATSSGLGACFGNIAQAIGGGSTGSSGTSPEKSAYTATWETKEEM